MWTIWRYVVLTFFSSHRSQASLNSSLTMIAISLFILFTPQKLSFSRNLYFSHRLLLISGRNENKKKKNETEHFPILCSSNKHCFTWLEKLYKINICIKWLNTCVKLIVGLLFYYFFYDYYHSCLCSYTCLFSFVYRLQSVTKHLRKVSKNFGWRLNVQFSMFRAKVFSFFPISLSLLLSLHLSSVKFSALFFFASHLLFWLNFLFFLLFVTCDAYQVHFVPNWQSFNMSKLTLWYATTVH